MTSTLLETVATVITTVTALTALLAFFASISRNALLRRQIDQLQAWRSVETDTGRQATLDDLLAARRGQLLARQLTPFIARIGPPIGFLVLAAFGAQDGFTSIEYIADTDSYSFAGWVETYYIAWPELFVYVFTMFVIYAPTPYLSARHTMVGRMKATRAFVEGRPVTAPTGHFVWRDGPGAPKIVGRVWLGAYAAGLGTYLASGSLTATISLRLLDEGVSREMVLGTAGVVALTSTASFMILTFGALFPIWVDRRSRELPTQYPFPTIYRADRDWTPDKKQ